MGLLAGVSYSALRKKLIASGHWILCSASHLPSVDIESEDGGIPIRLAIRVILGEPAPQQLALWQAPDNAPSSLPDDIEPKQAEQGDTNEAS